MIIRGSARVGTLPIISVGGGGVAHPTTNIVTAIVTSFFPTQNTSVSV